jgi:desampylase
MTVTISSALAAQIVARTGQSPEVEVCGLLLGAPGRVDDIVPVANVATDPSMSFEVDPAALFPLLKAARMGGAKIVGSYHSHPSGLAEPSATDAAMIREEGELWFIVADGSLTAWRAASKSSFEPVELVLA